MRYEAGLLGCALLLAGCSSSDASSGGSGGGSGGAANGLELAPPERGFQVASIGTTIEPGRDVEYCEVGVLPGTAADEYWVGRVEVAMTPFSHHLNLYSVELGTAPESAEVGARVECLQPLLGFGTKPLGEEFRYVVGASRPYADRQFPDGVGLHYGGGQKIIFNYHYLNTSTEPVEARHLVNFHLVDAASVQRTPQLFAMMNQTISVASRSTASFTMECKAIQRVVVYGVSRHTHRWGRDFDAWFEGGARHGEHIFTSTDWSEGTEHGFDPPVELAPGEGFRFRCDFENTLDHTLAWGDKATDEMCILYGSWWIADAGQAPQSQSCLANGVYGTVDADGVAHGASIPWPAPSDS